MGNREGEKNSSRTLKVHFLTVFFGVILVIWCHLVVVIDANLNIGRDNSESRGSRTRSLIPEMYQFVGQIKKFS